MQFLIRLSGSSIFSLSSIFQASIPTKPIHLFTTLNPRRSTSSQFQSIQFELHHQGTSICGTSVSSSSSNLSQTVARPQFVLSRSLLHGLPACLKTAVMAVLSYSYHIVLTTYVHHRLVYFHLSYHHRPRHRQERRLILICFKWNYAIIMLFFHYFVEMCRATTTTAFLLPLWY